MLLDRLPNLPQTIQNPFPVMRLYVVMLLQVIRVFLVAIERVNGGVLASHALGAFDCPNLLAGVSGKPLVHDVPCVGEKIQGQKCRKASTFGLLFRYATSEMLPPHSLYGMF